MRTVLVQTLITRRNQVLLGRWRPGSGPFAGRLTGVLGQAKAPPGGPPPTPEAAAAAACSELLGVHVDPWRLRRRALFHFEERDPSDAAAALLGDRYSEHQLVLRLGPDEASGGSDDFEPRATERFEPFGWFGPTEMPYNLMPEDDEVWYDRVVFQDHRLRGNFAFEGTRLAAHSVEEVDAAEGLCDLDVRQDGKLGGEGPSGSGQLPLLLYNPACSKSRALREALQHRGVAFSERRYLEDPLTLSELETLHARLQEGGRHLGEGASASPVGAATALCRDTDLARDLGLANLFKSGFYKAGSMGSYEDVVLEALAKQPDLLQRPVLVVGRRAALGRPEPEAALRLLADA